MLGPYRANNDGTIDYIGNKIFSPMKNISLSEVPLADFEKRVEQLNNNEMWTHISRINNQINLSATLYFDEINAIFTSLPLTTRMISSPGAVYGKEKIDYTTDTCPITLKWFDLPNEIFLSESSQIYLELSLVQKDIDKVYSIYNSFRKERADMTHLSEFHHIEFEGKINQEQNEQIIKELLKRIISDLIIKRREDLSYFLTDSKIDELKNFVENLDEIKKITFKEALNLLYLNTKNDKYLKFTLEHFGSWEEIKITEILGGMAIIGEFPLLEVPFYHAVIDNKEPLVANNSDFIWSGYREIIGSGHRVRSKKELLEKAEIFNLPIEDYQPYIQTRNLKNYQESSGFGLGWERFLQGLLEMPFIWSAVQFPRVDGVIKP